MKGRSLSRGRSGGRAGGAGYDFQDLYVAWQLAKMLMGDRDPIKEVLWEKKVIDAGEGRGAEPTFVDDTIIWLRSGKEIYTQVKEMAPNGVWSIRNLISSGVIRQFWQQWDSTKLEYRRKTFLQLSSSGRVTPLRLVNEAALRARTPAELLSAETSTEVVNSVEAMAAYLDISPDEAELLRFLRAIIAEQLPDANEIYRFIIQSLALFSSEAPTVADRLVRIVAQSKQAGPSAGSSLTRPSLIDQLREDGIQTEILAGEASSGQATRKRGDSASNFLQAHGALQRNIFQSDPVLGREPFAIRDIYVDPYCRTVSWSRFSETVRSGVPSTSNEFPGRPMTEVILGQILDAELDDFIFIQGPPGSGKSAFGLSLANELLTHGLHPIRIALRDLRTLEHDARNTEIGKEMKRAIQVPEDHCDTDRTDMFIDGEIFRQRRWIPEKDIQICPYVLILDGWDEIRSHRPGSSERLLRRLLTYLQENLIEGHQPPVRVVLLGRSSRTLWKNIFLDYLRPRTPIHTILPFSPKQLDEFLRKLDSTIRKANLTKEEAESWKISSPARLRAIVSAYEEAFDELRVDDSHWTYSSDGPKGLELLCYPLLALLGTRLIAGTEVKVKTLLSDESTTLFRRLLDMTCEKAGRDSMDELRVERLGILFGAELREFLRSVATALEAQGGKSISYEELGPRIDPRDHIRKAPLKSTEDYTDKLNRLNLSYYFSEHRNSYEFSHPSLQGFIFAEHIVELLKKEARVFREEDGPTVDYSQDFENSDPFHTLSRRLSYLLAPQWLRNEVWNHRRELTHMGGRAR